MFKRYILPLFALAVIVSLPVYASEMSGILTEDQFFGHDQVEYHPALIEPAAGPAKSLDSHSPAKILTEDQFFGYEAAEGGALNDDVMSVPSIYSEHDY